MTLKDLEKQLWEIAATADPDHHEKGRMDTLRAEINIAITMVKGMISDEERKNKRWWQKLIG